jgi:hypothetical protein
VDIEGWLRDLGLQQYADAFRANDIGVDVVAELTDADLKELGDLGRHRIKGFEDSVAAFAVRGERATASRFEGRAAGALRPMVGRDEELALLLRQWRLARSGEG